MNIRSFTNQDAQKLVALWNCAHPQYPLTKEQMAKKVFLDTNFQPKNLLIVEENQEIIAFAYVPQGNSIFSGTIARNLRIVAPEATDAELEEALKIACAWEFVSQFPEGIHHQLGTGGRGVSEGQAQRLAIARALLKKAPIMLLDEATSGLDEATEQRLMENLRRSGRVHTCILVTHRPGSAEFCNRTYEVCKGQVSEVNHGA